MLCLYEQKMEIKKKATKSIPKPNYGKQKKETNTENDCSTKKINH